MLFDSYYVYKKDDGAWRVNVDNDNELTRVFKQKHRAEIFAEFCSMLYGGCITVYDERMNIMQEFQCDNSLNITNL